MIKLAKYSYRTETQRCIEWLEAMALQGWMVENFTRNLDFMRFRKDVPHKVHYYFYFNDHYELDEASFIESAKAQGWINLNKNPILARSFLFVSTQNNPTPLETDDLEQGNMYRTTKRKPNKFMWALIVISVPFILLNFITRGWTFILAPGFWPAYTLLLWTWEFTVMPKRIKRMSDDHRRRLALFFRAMRFSVPLMWVGFLWFSLNYLLPIN